MEELVPSVRSTGENALMSFFQDYTAFDQSLLSSGCYEDDGRRVLTFGRSGAK